MSVIELDVTEEIIKEITAATKKVVEYYKLGNTDLIDSIEWRYKDDAFVLVANDYFKYIDSGRRPRARKVPVEYLIKWMRKKGIKPRRGQTINSLAYAIQNGIYKAGIRAKKLLDPIINVTMDILAIYIAEDLSFQIADEIAEMMTFNLPTNT